MSAETIGIVMGMSLLLWSAVHDHLYSRGERKTTFFKWAGINYSLLLNWAESMRKSDTKTKARQKR